MCRSMVDIQSVTAEIRRGKKDRKKERNHDKNIMACPITCGGHNQTGSVCVSITATVCYRDSQKAMFMKLSKGICVDNGNITRIGFQR